MALVASPVRPQGCAVACTPPPLGLTAYVSWAEQAVYSRSLSRSAPCLGHCIAQIDDFELLRHDQPLASEFPKRTQGRIGALRRVSFARGRPWSGRCSHRGCQLSPRLAQSLCSTAQTFRRKPAVGPEFRLEGPCIRAHPPLAKIPMLKPPRTLLRFSRTRSAVSGLPA